LTNRLFFRDKHLFEQSFPVDVYGAAWAGWQTAFISRPGQQLYPLADKPAIIAPGLSEIANKLVEAKK
jgi:2-haloacid dehalogenase